MISSLPGLVTIAALACGQAPSQSDRAIAQLRADLTRLSADQQALLARLAVVEAAQSVRAPGPRQAQGAARSGGDLHDGLANGLGPARAPEAGSPSSDSDGTHSQRGVQPSDPGARSAKGQAPASSSAAASATGSAPASATGSAPASATARIGANREYDAALALLRAKSYDPAIEGLTAFLVRYPDHPNAENAMYWRGEAFQAQGEYGRAVQEYEGLMARFPFGSRTAEALLGLGTCEQKLGQGERAEEAFAQLRERYPKSMAAQKVPGK